MNYTPTATLALVLALGFAGAAAAQGVSPNPGVPGSSPGTSAATQTQTYPNGSPATGASPQATYNQSHPQTQATYGQTQPSAPGQPGYAQTAPSATQPYGQPQTAPGEAENARSSQVRQAQEQLRAAGLYNGPVDGLMDPDTRAAIARFQEQNGLQRTETLDQQTMAQLTAAQPSGYGSSAPGAVGTMTMPNATPAESAASPSAGENTTAQPLATTPRSSGTTGTTTGQPMTR